MSSTSFAHCGAKRHNALNVPRNFRKHTKAVIVGLFLTCLQLMKPGCTCLSHKEGLMEWKWKDQKRPCIAKRTISLKKMLYAIFFNSSGPVVQVPCPSGHTVTGQFYKNSVLKKMKEFYNKKQPSKGWSGVHLLHDNASSHKCEVVKSFLASERWKF